MSRRGWLGVAAGCGAAAIWGGVYVVSKYVLEYVPPLTLVFARLVIGAVTLAAIAALTQQPRVTRRDLPEMVLIGFVGLFISIVAQFAGTRLSTAAYGSLITSATPGFLVLFAWPILGERLTWPRIVSLALATAGVSVTVLLEPATGPAGDEPSTVLLGNLLLVAAALTWALYSALAARAARRYPVLVTTCYATAIGAVFTLLAVPFELAVTPLGPVPPLVWLGVLYLGTVATAGAFYLWNKSIEILGAGVPSILFFVQPVVGGLFGALLLGESLGLPFVAGGGLILLAVIVTARERST